MATKFRLLYNGKKYDGKKFQKDFLNEIDQRVNEYILEEGEKQKIKHSKKGGVMSVKQNITALGEVKDVKAVYKEMEQLNEETQFPCFFIIDEGEKVVSQTNKTSVSALTLRVVFVMSKQENPEIQLNEYIEATEKGFFKDSCFGLDEIQSFRIDSIETGVVEDFFEEVSEMFCLLPSFQMNLVIEYEKKM